MRTDLLPMNGGNGHENTRRVTSKMEIRVLESGGIQAMAEYLEEAIDSTFPRMIFERGLREVYTESELERMNEERLTRVMNLAWAQACLYMAEQYFLRAAGSNG